VTLHEYLAAQEAFDRAVGDVRIGARGRGTDGRAGWLVGVSPYGFVLRTSRWAPPRGHADEGRGWRTDTFTPDETLRSGDRVEVVLDKHDYFKTTVVAVSDTEVVTRDGTYAPSEVHP
jgi:hypothetical protein